MTPHTVPQPTVPYTHTHTHRTPPQDDSICLQSSSSLDVLQPPHPSAHACCTHLAASSWLTPPPLLLTCSCTPTACHRLLLHHAIPNSTTRERHLPRHAQRTTSTPSSPRAAAAPLDLLRVHGWRRTVAAAAARCGFLNSAVGISTQWTRGSAAIRAHSRVEVVTLLLLLIRAEFRHGGF